MSLFVVNVKNHYQSSYILCADTHTLNSNMKGLISQNVPQACCAIVLKTIKLVGNSETMNWNTKRRKKTGA